MDPVFSLIQIRPFINLSDLNDGFDKVLEEPDQKRSVKSARCEIEHFFTFTLVLGRFFHGSGFFWIRSGFLADPDSEKKSDPGKKPRSETLHFKELKLRG